MTRATKLNYVTCVFGKPGSWMAGKHTGVDFRAPVGTPIFATFPGVVVHEGYGGYGEAYGKHIIMSCKYKRKEYRVLYAHLDKSWVNVGEYHKAGDEIGISGTTGNTFGPHLHYEERVAPFNYWSFIRPVLLYWRPLNPFLRRKIQKQIDASK